MDRYRYYRSILSVMLATDSIDLSVKNCSFFIDSIDHRSEKKIFSPIKSNHRLKIFFSSKDHPSNRCFLQLIDYQYRSNRCFFRHRCPPMDRSYIAAVSGSLFLDSEGSHMVKSQLGHEGETFLKVKSELSL